MNRSICARLLAGLLDEQDGFADRLTDRLGPLPGRGEGGPGQLVDLTGVPVLAQGRGGDLRDAGRVIRLLLDWVAHQFRELSLPAPDDLAITLVGAYQGMSLLANALRDPEIMTREGNRLLHWLDTVAADGPGHPTP